MIIILFLESKEKTTEQYYPYEQCCKNYVLNGEGLLSCIQGTGGYSWQWLVAAWIQLYWDHHSHPCSAQGPYSAEN